MKTNLTLLSVAFAALIASTGCKKNNDNNTVTPSYTIPTTYTFDNVDYSESTTRLGMITEMQTVMKTATTTALDDSRLQNMFTNTNSPFTTVAYNTSGIQLKDQCATQLQTDVINDIEGLAAASKSGVPASRGVAGVGTSSANAATKYALSATGVNYAQVYNKGMMGGFITYQIVTHYMAAALANSLDNTTVVAGKGTAAEHNWDLAFGLWGVPTDFPTNKTGAILWGSYSTQVDSGFHANKILMTAFITGRAAIHNKDVKTMQAQAAIIVATFEKLTAAAVLQEVNEIKESISDNIARNSRLSECWGFVNSFHYNPTKTVLKDADVDAILAKFPANFYDLTSTDITNIQEAVAQPYGFENVKDIL